MSRRRRTHRSSRRLLLAAVGFVLVSSLLSVGPAGAHTFTKTDGNDSPSKLDLRSVSVSHTSTGLVHKVTTYGAWTARSLGGDSFFIIQIDKNNGPQGDYERCAFIFYTNRLRGSLTNCGAQFIRFLPVSKVSGTTAKITVPKSQTGSVFRWAAASLWVGPAPCGGRGCVDFAPNQFPDMLHEMVPPVITMTTTPLRVWESSTNGNFTFPFDVSDAHTGIQAWALQSRPVGSLTWTTVASGAGAGAKSPDITGVEGTRTDYRVVATDKQGNKKISPSRRVYIPTDDDNLAPAGVFSNPPTPVLNGVFFSGGYSPMAASETLTYTFTPPGGDCTFELIGPGDGTWSIEVSADGGTATPVSDPDIDNLPRQTVYTDGSCATTYVVTVVAGTFNLDAVLGN